METTITTVPSARIRTPEVASHIGETVRVAGWLHALRRLGGVSFLVVRDGWGIVQAVGERSRTGAAPRGGRCRRKRHRRQRAVAAAPQAPGGVELREIAREVIEPSSRRRRSR